MPLGSTSVIIIKNYLLLWKVKDTVLFNYNYYDSFFQNQQMNLSFKC